MYFASVKYELCVLQESITKKHYTNDTYLEELHKIYVRLPLAQAISKQLTQSQFLQDSMEFRQISKGRYRKDRRVISLC
jgi:hypothetical protein